MFQENLGLSFGLDLADLSREKWSVVPKLGDLVTEIQTGKAHSHLHAIGVGPGRHPVLRSHAPADDLHLRVKAEARRAGPFFSEDDQIDYDILNYDIDASFDPQREWIDGTARLYLVAKRRPSRRST